MSDAARASGRLTSDASNEISARMQVLRSVAAILLASYHVIGSTPRAGLEVDYPDVLRYFADGLADVRMPLFAFVAGAVYAMRPPGLADLRAFVQGKALRLLAPGAVAATCFAVVAVLLDVREMRQFGSIFEIYVFSYAHFWYLQAIFVILIIYSALDVLTQRRGASLIFLIHSGIFIAGLRIDTDLFSLRAVTFLFLYFGLGVLVYRERERVFENTTVFLASALALAALGVALNFVDLHATGRLSQNRLDLQSYASGVGVCVAALLLSRRVAVLEWLAPYTFTIYLYHVFGTSGARRALDAFGVEDVGAHLAVGLGAGLALPIVIHAAASRSRWASRLVLGLRR